ncbi:MAG TPA: serine/threonine-protein kinase [Polyangiaceae bacterium]
MSEPALQLLSVGAVLRGRYEVLRCIKAGGMGAVYEVLDRETRRRRAMKTMLPSFVSDPDLRARFRLEATVAADVESEHIVEVFDAGVDAETGLPFLVMELLRGESVGQALERRGRIPPGEVVLWLEQVSLALDRTHAAGIVHRDLKPENLFLTARDDGTPRLKVLDFGIAKVVAQSTNANTTRNLGTPLYMSPEQIRGDGDIGHRADLYSLGQIAFTLLAGRAYWEPESRRAGGIYALLLKVMEGPREPASVRAAGLGANLPPAFDAWFRRATALADHERFESSNELVAGLRGVFGIPPARSGLVAGGTEPGTTTQDAFSTTLRSSSAPLPAQAPIAVQVLDSTGAVSSASRLAAELRPAAKRRWLVPASLLAVVAGGLSAYFVVTTRPAPGAPEVSPSVAPPSGTTRETVRPELEVPAAPEAPAVVVPPAVLPSASAAAVSTARVVSPAPPKLREPPRRSAPPRPPATLDDPTDTR